MVSTFSVKFHLDDWKASHNSSMAFFLISVVPGPLPDMVAREWDCGGRRERRRANPGSSAVGGRARGTCLLYTSDAADDM
eukprot:748935-Alexandrium_andersonii.AAC.1